MKKLFTLVLAAFLAGNMSAQLIEPEMTFKKKIHDFGIVSQDTCVVTCTFKFKNTGNGPLIIHQAATSCGCTVPEYTEEPIAPGATGTIKVTYNGKTKRPGVFKKSITLHSNAKNTPVRLYIQGEMIVSGDIEDVLEGTDAMPIIQDNLDPEELRPIATEKSMSDTKASKATKSNKKTAKKNSKKK